VFLTLENFIFHLLGGEVGGGMWDMVEKGSCVSNIFPVMINFVFKLG
jgi:hypothetical protein